MTSRERVKRALTFSCPDKIPRDLWILPIGLSKYAKEIDAILESFPMDIEMSMWPKLTDYGKLTQKGGSYAIGDYVDEWGSTFKNVQEGIIGQVKDPLIKSLADVNQINVPYESIEKKMEIADKVHTETNKFILGGSFNIDTFERMQLLRGPAQLYMDIIDQSLEFFKLRDIVHEYHLKELEAWAKTDSDGIMFADDWGSQKSLLIHPDLWRKFFKPLYEEYCQIIHNGGKFVFMHSDGYIFDIYQDLIEIGVDAINSQLFCMNIEEIGKKFKGKITFWGEIDRQHVLISQDARDARAAVQRVKDALYDRKGGIVAQCEFSAAAKPKNVEVVFEEWRNIT